MTSVVRALLPLALGFLVAGCDETRHRDATAAIRAVMTSSGGIWLAEMFPKKPDSISCVIHGGGPAPGIRVPGECRSAVTFAADGSARVRFTETWNGHRFRGPGSRARPGLSHTWELSVSPGRRVSGARQYGDFPPQNVI